MWPRVGLIVLTAVSKEETAGDIPAEWNSFLKCCTVVSWVVGSIQLAIPLRILPWLFSLHLLDLTKWREALESVIKSYMRLPHPLPNTQVASW